jgi:hypothetical protein
MLSDGRAQVSVVIVARRDHDDARRTSWRRRGRWKVAEIKRARRMLLERPHRRTQPEAAHGRSPSGARDELLISLKQRDAILNIAQSLQNPLLELVHYRLLKNIGDQEKSAVTKAILPARVSENTLHCNDVRMELLHPAYQADRGRDGEAMPASSTARMPVRKMPSNVPAPPIEATGAPSPAILSRFRRSAPISVPIEPPT